MTSVSIRQAAGRALDVLFARHILGWTEDRTETHTWYEPVSGLWKEPDNLTVLPACKKELQLVLESVLDKFADEEAIVELGRNQGGYWARVTLKGSGEDYLAGGTNPGEALARAALLAVLGEEVLVR